MVYLYSDIPDTLRTKQYFPLGRHLWRIYTALGWEFLESRIGEAIELLNYDNFKIRLNEAIMTAKATLEGKIKQPEITIADTLFPPGGTIRADLQQGVMKLYYGESTDCTYIGIRDDTQEVCVMLNGHLEDGFPIDWWLVGPDDELLDRRHIKLGYKLKNIPKKTKNTTEMGYRFLDVLRDVRNERTPQWASSAYQTAVAWGTGAYNLAWEFSSYEAIGGLYDGISAKTYGMPDYWYAYIPWPPIIQTAIYGGRTKFILFSIGLLSENRLYFQHMEEDYQNINKNIFPETWKVGIVDQWNSMGVPFPQQTIGCELPNYKKDETYEADRFGWKYPPGPWITLDKLQMDLQDIFNGLYLDITHETDPEGITDLHSKIISTGIGRNTKFINRPT